MFPQDIGLVLSALGTLLIALSPAGTAMAWCVVQGISAGYVMPVTLASMKAYFDGKKRQRALSFWSIGSGGRWGLRSLGPKLGSSNRSLFRQTIPARRI